MHPRTRLKPTGMESGARASQGFRSTSSTCSFQKSKVDENGILRAITAYQQVLPGDADSQRGGS